MRTESYQFATAQNEALQKCIIEAQKNSMQYHEVSRLHAEALLKVGNVKVFGFTPSGFVLIPSISELTNFEKYFID